jgi:hypothetical protein
MVARSSEAEHRAVGDKATGGAAGERWRLPGSRLFAELVLTFGDWVALGDWFEDVSEIKHLIHPHVKDDTVGQVYYALLVGIRPTTKEERRQAEQAYMGTLFTEEDKKEAEARFEKLATANVKHFPNPLVGDMALSTAEKARRSEGGKPLGAIAQYHAGHLDAVGYAASGGQLRDEHYLGEALAIDGFACHFLTDAFSGSHVRTPRLSIKTYWDAKVPRFRATLLNWLVDEVAFAVDTSPNGVKEFLGAVLDPTFHVVRDEARKRINRVLPPLGFGDLVSRIVHDWEGAHGTDDHGPLVDIAGQRFRTVGDERLLPATTTLRNVDSDRELGAVFSDSRRSAAERTFAAEVLAVRTSVGDVRRAFELGKEGKGRSEILNALIGRDGLFVAERWIPTAVPDAGQPEDDRMPKWDYGTVDQLLADKKIRAGLIEAAKKVAEAFEDTVKGLEVSETVKNHLRRMVIDKLMPGGRAQEERRSSATRASEHDAAVIVEWIKNVLAYSPRRLNARLAQLRSPEPFILSGPGLRDDDPFR